MKTTSLLALFILLVSTVRGQADLAIALTSPQTGDTIINDSNFLLDFTVTNNGATAVPATNQIVYQFIVFGNPSQALELITPNPTLAPGESVSVSIPLSLTISASISPVDFCVSVMELDSSGTTLIDPNQVNNTSCASVSFVIASSIHDAERNKLEVAIGPNPASTHLNVKVVGRQAAKIEIYNLMGKKVFEQDLTNASETLDVSTLSRGAYLYVVSSKDGSAVSDKLIIE